MPREGLLVDSPLERMTEEQIKQIHGASLEVLRDPGLLCFNRQAADIFHEEGAKLEEVETNSGFCSRIRIPAEMVENALESAPKTVKLGARNPDNALIMKGDEPRVNFVTGSETNIWLDVHFEPYVRKSGGNGEVRIPEYHQRRGTVNDLCRAAHVCEHLDTVDAFIRTVNIQDDEITNENKDVNKYFASLNNTTKHVMAGLTELSQLDNVLRMAELIAGGEDELRENPIISFITCLVKSPLQFVEDTTDTMIALCRKGLPVVASSAPQAGSTAPMKEDGIIAQINAEVLAGITLSQLVNKGTPVIYGSVPVKARLDTLHDSYGAPETSQYNIDCVQLARFYKIPCYSTSGVCDAAVPGFQSTVERLFSDILVTLSGPQYLHCAYGLFDGNSIFCLEQAVMDDAHFNMIKFFLRPPKINESELNETLKQIRKVADTPQKIFIRYIRPLMRKKLLSDTYPFEGSENKDEALFLAQKKMNELLEKPVDHIDQKTTEKIFREIPGLMSSLNVYES